MPNAFTALMTGNIETKQWKEAEAADKRKGRVAKGEHKAVPFYKWVEGLEITVDAFRYNKIEGCKGYFLSHAHCESAAGADRLRDHKLTRSHVPVAADHCAAFAENLLIVRFRAMD